MYINNYNGNKFFFKNCQTCSLALKDNLFMVDIDMVNVNTEEVSLRNKLYLSCPELDLRINSMKIICEKCFSIVNNINRFIYKYYESTGQLNRNFHSNQNIYLSEHFSFDIKYEIKTEDLDLSETVNFTETGLSCSKTTNNSKIDINLGCNYNRRQNMDFTLIENDQVSYKTLQNNKKHMCKTVDNKPYLHHLYNFKNTCIPDWRKQLKRAITKQFNYSGYDYNSTNEMELKNFCPDTEEKLVKNCLIIHSKKKPFKCIQCDYKSANRSSLKRHLRIHTVEKPIKCSQCDYRCTNKSSLRSHIRIHTGEKPFKCTQCDYSSIHKNSWIHHLRTHIGDKPFKCCQCNYSCTNNSSLRSHVRIHSGEKPFKCSQCEYSCTHKNSLINHIRNHTREKPFKCYLCDCSFINKASLKSHTLSHIREK